MSVLRTEANIYIVYEINKMKNVGTVPKSNWRKMQNQYL